MKQSANRIKYIAKQLSTLPEDLSFEAEEGWTSSLYYIARSLDERACSGTGFDDRQSALMAAGRLDWLLHASRFTLSGLFSEKEIFTLVNCYQGTVFSPDQISTIASDVCHDLGIELDDYEDSSAAPLINKLLSLDPLQGLILADILERIWYQPRGKIKQIPEVFESLGIQLK